MIVIKPVVTDAYFVNIREEVERQKEEVVRQILQMENECKV